MNPDNIGIISAKAAPPPMVFNAHAKDPSFSLACIPKAKDKAIKIPPATTKGII